MNRRFSALPAILIAAAAACRDAREDARTELTRLGNAMTAHAARFGRYPEVLDATRPADASNLPFRAEHGVEVRLLQSGPSGWQAGATRRSWVCIMAVGPGDRRRMECAPVGSATRAANAAAGLPVDPPPGVLHSPPVTPADSDSTAAAR
ncbi:MAG TPA: hypothetical protein VFJ16_31945 [Longimicrobium sp.]|nr:hypothetical protein [Longimicrobium sp.]